MPWGWLGSRGVSIVAAGEGDERDGENDMERGIYRGLVPLRFCLEGV